MKSATLYIIITLLSGILLAQQTSKNEITGRVSYQSIENTYVKFVNTEGVEKGDTLWLKSSGSYIPVLKVFFISSKSVSGNLIGKRELKINDELTAFINIKTESSSPLKKEYVLTETDNKNYVITNKKKFSKIKEMSGKLKGKITLQSYSNFSNQSKSNNYQRWRYTFRLDAKKIGGTDLSFSHYINFAYRADEWNEIQSNLSRALRIYDLTLQYDFSAYTTLWFGRHINKNVSSIGSVDGLQFETSLPVFSVGLIAGSRPDFRDMGFNGKLFQYGFYFNRIDSVGYSQLSNTLGYFEQTNNFKTDRRFVYFQHSNSLIKNTRLFLSTEVDLFKKESGETKNELTLTSLFVSASIRPSKYYSLYFSYDARKNVIYYETFKSFADSVFENETRQGFRTRVTVKPVKYLTLGLNYGYRFRKGDPKPSNNYGGYITYSMIPFIRSGITLRISELSGTYANGTTWGVRIYKNLNWGMGISLGYRNTKYNFSQNIEAVTQQSVTVYINTSILQPMYINFGYEGVFQSIRSSGRILLNLAYRF
jgi:hypothetical protein